MRLKRVLFFSLLFSLLVGSLLYFLLPRLLYRPRIDSIPSGAYVVPWMRPDPSIETLKNAQSPWDIGSVMEGALRWEVTFSIDIESEVRVVPSTIYMCHDMDYLYVGGKFEGMFLNPTNEPTMFYPNCFDMFFDVADDGELSFPEGGLKISVIVHNDTWQTTYWFRDLLWYHYDSPVNRECWIFAEEYYSPKGVPGFSIERCTAEYENSTGTMTVLFSRHLRHSETAEINGLQMKPGERWVMGFLLELGFASWGELFNDFVDGWPQKTYPYLSNDSPWWPKIAIDLTNPPEGF